MGVTNPNIGGGDLKAPTTPHALSTRRKSLKVENFVLNFTAYFFFANSIEWHTALCWREGKGCVVCWVWCGFHLVVVWSWVVDRSRVIWGWLGMVWSRVVWSRFVNNWSRVVWSWLGWVVWSRLVDDGGRVVWLGVVWLVVWLSLILDVGNVAVFVVGGVGDNLCATVRKGDAVLAGDCAVVVLDLLLVEESAGVLVLDSVLIGERPGRDLVGVSVMNRFVWGRGRVVGGRMVGGRVVRGRRACSHGHAGHETQSKH